MLGISPKTGEIIYMCDANGCPRNPTASTNKDVLVIRTVRQTVRAIDPRTGEERYNTIVFLWQINNKMVF